MLNRKEHDGLIIYTSDDPARVTEAVIETPDGFYHVRVNPETYTEDEGAIYAAFYETVMDHYREGRAEQVTSVQDVFGS